MNISGKIEKAMTKRQMRVLRRIGEAAECLGYKAYLVGGSVRDIMLGRKSPDIDIVIEGDAIALGAMLAGELRAKITAYRPFGTCTLCAKGLKTIDLATARKETYKKPGAMPSVTPSSIKEDLFRRDFTINAIAVSIGGGDFGVIFDPFAGLKDIRNGAVRVMHGKSFIDDPTRIFRAMRFAARFGFKIDKDTEGLMRDAARRNVFATVSQGRIRKELSLLMRSR